MTQSGTTNWDPEQELAALLDGLTEELLGAFDHEIIRSLNESDDERQDKVDAVRRLVARADGDLGLPPVSRFVGSGPRADAARNR